MFIKKILSQHRNDFTATIECEHCGSTQKLGSGYHDSFYHEKVIPAIACHSCGKKRDGAPGQSEFQNVAHNSTTDTTGGFMSESKQQWTPGPWEVDTIDNDGEYGDGGPDVSTGFKSYQVVDAQGQVLFDSLNSNAAVVHEDGYDIDHYAWDEVARRNLTAASATPDLISALQWAQLHFRLDGEGSQDHFDRISEAFRNDTGYLRPGQDCRLHSLEERQRAWDSWMSEGKRKIRAALAKAGA